MYQKAEEVARLKGVGVALKDLLYGDMKVKAGLI